MVAQPASDEKLHSINDLVVVVLVSLQLLFEEKTAGQYILSVTVLKVEVILS